MAAARDWVPPVYGREVALVNKERRVVVADAPDSGGTVTISDEVLAEVAQTEATCTDGVVMNPATGRKAGGRRQTIPGVSVQVSNGEATFDLTIGVQGGTRIPVLAATLRERIASAVRAKTGYTVVAVNVLVDRVVFG